MRDRIEVGHRFDRVADQFVDGNAFVGDAVDEAGVGAVFQQAAHQVGQQVFVRTDRCVHAAGHVEAIRRDHFGIQVVAHAVQLLELEVAAVAHRARHPVHRRDRLCVVRGEHRIHRVAGIEQAARVGEIRHVGVLLAGEQRIAGLAVHLRALDLRIPVRALDQSHRDAAAELLRHVRDMVDHERCALLVGLHHDAEAVPVAQRLVGQHLEDQVQRQFEAVGFLGVDGQADAVGLRQLRQFQQAGAEFGQHAGALGVFVARVQRRELHRDRWRGEHVGERAGAADRMDRLPVGLEVAQRILGGQRAFAEHVEGIAVIGVVALAAARQGFVDGPPEHELVAHDLHRLAHGEADHRLAGAADQALEGAVHVAPGVVGEVDQLAGQHQAPGRGIDQHGVGLAEVALPVGVAQLVADQRVGGALVGDAQQGFGHAHQQHALLAAEVVLAHEGLDRALVAGAGAHPADEVGGGGLGGGALGIRQGRLHQQFAHMGRFVADPAGGDRCARRRRDRVQFRGQDRRDPGDSVGIVAHRACRQWIGGA